MDQQALQKLKQILGQAESLGIVVGPNPTIDEMGAALSLYLSLKAAQKKVSIASPTEPIVEVSNLVGIDQVKSSLGGTAAGDLVVSFPYKEGEIEKVSYTLESGFLNIVVKAGELGLNFEDQDVRFTRGGGGVPSVILVVGVARLSDLGNVYNPEEMKDAQIVNIDNKPDNQGFGDVALVSPRMSSISESVAEILLSLNLPMDVDVAQNLLSGISYSTNNFQDPSTSFLAFEMAGELMRLGAMRRAIPASSPMPTPIQSGPRTQRPQAQPQPRPQYPAMNNGMDDYNDDLRMPLPQPMPRPQQRMPQQPPRMAPQSQPQRSGQPMPQQRYQQPQPRMSQMPNRGQQATQPMNSTQSRQDQIREELARAARQQDYGNDQIDDMPEPMDEQPRQQTNGRSQNPPSDWLTPKVYKGSTDVNN